MDIDLSLLTAKESNKVIPKEELLKAQEELCKHARNKSFFRINQFYIQIGVTIGNDFSYQNQRRSYFSECRFFEANFTSTGMTGSFFLRSQFEKCVFKNTVLDSCNFTDCTFIDIKELTIPNANFNNAVFVGCKFENIIFDSCMASNSLFEGTIFVNCTFLGTLWEYSTFKNVIFDSCILKGLNFEMCIFENIHLYNIRFPFPTIPYIINGIKYILSTDDNFVISSFYNEDGKMSKEEYISLLPALKTFYTGTQNYYPLANIYVGEQDYDNAFIAIINAVKMAIRMHSFRSLKTYCLLLKTVDKFDQHYFNYVYEVIQKEIESQIFTPNDYYVLGQYLTEVRNLLICGNNGTMVGITIKTNIKDNEFSKLGVIISIISNFIDYSSTKANNFIEIRHFSPYELFCQVISDPKTVFCIIGMIYSGLLGIDTLIKKYRENYTISLTNQHIAAETRLFNAQAEQIELQNQTKKLQADISKQEEKIDTAQKTLKQNNIIISSINHTIINGNIIECDPIFQNHTEEKTFNSN